ncbi:MAG TPA: hypothetical protein VJ792_08225 [Candidatus Nitrosotalea sp.]|nr:hypothetical protein [Candidatus Nitrosotalea sp.]
MKKIENVTRDNEYASVFADGIMIEIGDEVTKLIFYQNSKAPSDEGTLNPYEAVKVLKFEVRIPQSVFERTSKHSLDLNQAIDQSYDAIEGIKDEKINELHAEFTSKLQNYLFDSNLDYSQNNEVKEVIDQFYDLLGRCKREKSKQPQPELPK